ncbi:efflux RND transporter periplasmic adaptor subunit [Akkermansiaceae bacterium]|nr:efflux RND transporter periplasmic adaptor subunit [Akkermansiaceae bacterium]
MKKIIIVTLIIVLASAGIFFISKGDKDSNQKRLEFVTVQQGEMLISIKESGFINSVEEVTIKNTIRRNDITIIDLIEDGSYVKEGEFLMELDSGPLLIEKEGIEETLSDKILKLEEAQNSLEITKSEVESAVIAAKNTITFAEVDIKKFTEFDKERQLSDASSEISSAEDQAKFAQQTHDNSKELVDKGFETKSTLDRNRFDLDGKNKQLESAVAKQTILIKYDLPKEELKLKLDLEEAKNKLIRTKKEGENKIKKSEAAVKNALQAVEKYKLYLERVNESIAGLKIVSPVTGYALYPKRKNSYSNGPQVAKGQKVNPNQTLMRIPKMDNMKIDIEVAEHIISDLIIGQTAVVSIDSIKNRQFPGKVDHISLLPIQKSYWDRGTAQKYNVTVDVDDSHLPKDIKPQITASAEILLNSLEGIISVPIQAVYTVKDRRVVYVRDDSAENGFVERVIKIGKLNTTSIQILSGLEKGEEVLVSEPF